MLNPSTKRLIAALIAALIVLAVMIEWRDPSIDLRPGTEPFRQPSDIIPLRVRVAPYDVIELPRSLLPYNSESVAAILSDKPTDDTGVRMHVTADGRVNHPVSQAQYGLALLGLYHLTGAPRHLELAELQADRLLDTAIESRGAVFFPYPFDFFRHSDPSDAMRAPWFSAMAQGQALSLFERLFEVTHDPRYRVAADRAFASFLLPEDTTGAGQPWTVFVDEDGYYWPEEYAADIPDRTFNGIVFAAFGLYDYFRSTNVEEAEILFQATLTTVMHALDGIRVPGEASRYCLAHGVQSDEYHAIHISQLRDLHRMTGAPAFDQWAVLLESDSHPGLNQ
jgi:hypothetical protein